MKDIKIYTKGLITAEHVGGWASILSFQENSKELSGYIPNTDARRMELMAIISGIGALKEPCNIDIMLSSDYVFQAINSGKVKQWTENNWKDEKNQKIENEDLWRMLIIQHRVKKHNVKYLRERAPKASYYKRCDELANMAIQEFIAKNRNQES